MILGLVSVFEIAGYTIYSLLALIALWGLFCLTVVWMRVAQKRFRNEETQTEFLQSVEQTIKQGQFDAAAEMCMGDPRAMSQLVHLAIANRNIGYAKVRQLLLDRFQRDVLADLDYRLSWVSTVIKSAPMLGLLGTVIGMMGAFATLATAENVDPTALANDINVALRTTACGLSIAIPLIVIMNSVNVRIRKMEDLVAAGLNQFLEAFRNIQASKGQRG